MPIGKRLSDVWHEFSEGLLSARVFSAVTMLIAIAAIYRVAHPRWLSFTAVILIGLLLATLVIWRSDNPPTKRISVALVWILLFGFWYWISPAWLSAISAIILASLVTLGVYGERKPPAPAPVVPAPPPVGYIIEAWDTERQKLLLEAWKQTVAVQMHFNDLELRIRNYAVTLLLAAGGGAALSLRERIYFQVPGRENQIHISALVLAFGLLGWIAFYLMDRFWYHRLLYGAVRHGQFIEEKFGDKLSFLRLTGAIGDASSNWFLGVRVRSPRKIDTFYGIFALLLIAAIYVAYNAKQIPP